MGTNALSLNRRLLLAGMIISFILAMLSKYRLPCLWCQNHLSGTFYVSFFCFLGLGLWPKTRYWLMCLYMFLTATGLEFLQLWHPAFLEWLRSFWLGQVLLGSTFNPLDIPFYLLGALLTILCLRIKPILSFLSFL